MRLDTLQCKVWRISLKDGVIYEEQLRELLTLDGSGCIPGTAVTERLPALVGSEKLCGRR
jgi:hypothetical protein